jgi:uncharacterized protein YbaP (TraB family)
MIHLLLAASLSAAVPAVAPEPADVKPAMFVVRDADTTIYIFGTFHALDGQDDWFSGNLRSAFEDSQELMLETMVPKRRTAIAALTPTTGPTLAGYSVTPSASLLSTTKVAISAGHSRGMCVANGADMVLRHIAESEGKRVDGLETFDSQLKMFARIPGILPPAQPVSAPNGAQSPAPDLSATMSDMQTAWKHGDQTVFLRMVDEFRRGSPAAYRVMFMERNARWADWIAARMRTPGTVFVAVGAGHLVGKDSVLVRLAERGIESARLN